MIRTLFFVASTLLLPCLALGGDPSADLSVQIVPSGSAISPDGTESSAPSGAALTTTAGVWTWGAAAAGRPGENAINLNGVYAPGIGNLMEVANGGKLYVHAAVGTSWWVWQNGAFVPSSDPNAPPPPPPGPSAQCPSTAPAAAQRAGYTALVFCNDFTQPIPNSAGTGTPGGPNTWAQGCGGPGNSIWHFLFNQGSDCTSQGQVTDPATGTLAMHVVAFARNLAARVVIQTDDFTTHTPGQGSYFNFPQASYLVIRYRDNIEDVSHTCDSVNTDFFEWSHEGGAASSAVNEYDLIENWDAGVNCSPWNYGGAIHNWNNGTAGPMWGYNNCKGSCPSSLTNDNGGKPTSVYHSYGMLITVQSGNNISACGYVDDVLINCGGMVYPETECTGNGGAGGTPALNQSGCWGQRSIALLWVGSNNGQYIDRDIHAYIQSWQAWSCPAWNAGSDKISNPGVNTCYGPLINSENAPKGEKDRLLAMNESERQYVLSKMSPEIRAHWAEQGVN